MPKVFKTLPEKYESITRPMVIGMVKEVMKRTGIDAYTGFQFLGTATEAAQAGSILNNDDTIQTQQRDRVFVNIQEDYFSDRMSSQVLHRPENAFIFLDSALETYIKPVYSSTHVQVTMTYRAQDKPSAERWRDNLKTKMTDMCDTNLYEGTYHYPLPLELMVILEEIYDLREKQGGYGDKLDEYFMNHVDPRMRIVTNQGGKNPLVVMAETQGEIVGLWDFDRTPRQIEKTGDGETFSIEVGFTFNYEQPVGCDMSYPLMIHNQLIQYRPTYEERPSRDIDKKKSFTSSGEYFREFEYGKERYVPLKDHGILIPPFDEFIPNQVVSNTMRLFSVLVAISPSNKRDLMNLRDLLPQYEFKPRIEALLRSEAPWIHMPYRSIFNISLYRSTELQYWDQVEMDADLNIRATSDLDIRQYYHIRLSIMYDLTALKKEDRDRLKIHGCALADIMEELMPWRPRLKTIGNCYAPATEIDSAAQDIDKHVRGVSINGGWQFNTVQTLYIEANKEKDKNANRESNRPST
jgi:hypothetical protein